MKAAFPYKRLGRRKRTLLGYDGLWLGEEHLLAVHNRRFTEEYQRFELRDIQAIILRRKIRVVVPIYSLLVAVPLLILALVGQGRGSAPMSDTGWGLLGLLGVYLIAAAVYNGCTCSLQTAVGIYELPSLYRYRASKPILGTLDARIAEIQGTLPEDWDESDTLALAPTPPRKEPDAPTSSSSRLWALLACVGLLLDAGLSWAVRMPSIPAFFHKLSVPLTLVAVLLLIIAVIVSRRDKRYRHLRMLFITAALAVGIANYGTLFVGGVLQGLQRAQTAGVVPAWVNNLFYWLNQGAEVGLGSLGLLLILVERRTSSPPEST